MYEVSCPTCGHRQQAPFIRAGAVVICPRCDHKHQIQAGQIRRSAAAGGEGASVSPTAGGAASAPGAAASGKAAAVAAASSPEGSASSAGEAGEPPVMAVPQPLPPGLDTTSVEGIPSPVPPGLHSLPPSAGPMIDTQYKPAAKSRLPEAKPRSRPTPPPTPRASTASPPGSPPRRYAPAQRTRWLMLGAVVGAVVGLILALIIAPPWTSREPADSTPGGFTDLLTSDPSAPVLNAEPLRPEPWRAVLRPAERGTVLSDLVRLDRERRIRSSDHSEIYYALAIGERPELILSATLHLALVDEAGYVIAETQVPLALINHRAAVPVSVPIPPEYTPRIHRIDWAIDTGRSLPDTVLFDDTDWSLQIGGEGRTTLARIKVFNPANRPLSHAYFLLTALDDRDRPVGQWRLTWDHPVGPLRSFEFRAIIPAATELQIRRWTLSGAGVPEGT